MPARRLFALLVAVLAALAAAAPSFGAPSLTVSLSKPSLDVLSDATVDLALDPAPAAQAGRVTLYVPANTSLRLRRTPGNEVGKVLAATVDPGTGPVSATGTLVAANVADYLADACAPGAHAGVWLLSLSTLGVTTTIPLFVDEVTDPAEKARGGFRIDACLPSSPRIASLQLELSDAVRTPEKRSRATWRAIVAPLGATGVADPAVATESRAIVPVPVEATIEGEFDFVSQKAILAGKVKVAGKAADGRLDLLSGPKKALLAPDGTVLLDGKGRFDAKRPMDEATFFEVSGVLPAVDVTATECDAPVAPGGCVSALEGPVVVASDPLKVVIPPPPTLQSGDTGPEVRLLQKRLIALNYLPSGTASGVYDYRTYHAVVAFQGWEQLGRDGSAGPVVWRRLEKARAPKPWGGMKNGLELDRDRQVLFLVRNGKVVRAIHVSSGAGGITPPGRFSVFRKETYSYSVPFKVWLPWASYFTGGIAFHEYPSVPTYAASHGCVRVPSPEARIVYEFATYGSAVWVR